MTASIIVAPGLLPGYTAGLVHHLEARRRYRKGNLNASATSRTMLELRNYVDSGGPIARSGRRFRQRSRVLSL